MHHKTNGKQQRIAIEQPLGSRSGSSAESTSQRIETALSDAHEIVLAKSSEFIRQRPGTSLLLAVTIGGVLGWLIKRRG
jgi:ElaB/YqjD/DUF883 family membrane-anchored ribosome-binding protein